MFSIRPNLFCWLLATCLLPAALQHAAVGAEIDLKAVQEPLEKQKKKYGPYVGVFGGESTDQEAKMKIDYIGHSLKYDVLPQEGDFFLGLEVGYSWRTKYLVEFAIEAQALFSSTEINAVLSNRGNEEAPIEVSDVATASADQSYAVFLLNGSISLDLRRLRPHIGSFLPRIRPYVGGGIGGAQVWYRNQRIQTVGDVLGTPTAPSASPFNIDEFVFAYQVFVGLEFTINDKLSAFAEYRRLNLAKTNDLSEFESEVLLGGLNLRY